MSTPKFIASLPTCEKLKTFCLISGRPSTNARRLADLEDEIKKVGDEIKIVEGKFKRSNQQGASSMQLQVEMNLLQVDMQQLSEMLHIEKSTPAGTPELSTFTTHVSHSRKNRWIICETFLLLVSLTACHGLIFFLFRSFVNLH